MNGYPQIEVKDIPGYENMKLVKISGELDMVTTDSLRKLIDSYIAGGCLNLIFDLEALTFIDSIGNLALLSAHMIAKKKGGGIKLFGINDKIREILDVAGVSKIIPIYATYEEALQSLKI